MGYASLTSKENRERHRLISEMARLERDIPKWEMSWSDEDELDGAKCMVTRLNEQLTLQKKMLDCLVRGTTKT